MIYYVFLWTFEFWKIIILLKIKSNIRSQSFVCIHAAAYLFYIAWFEIRFQVELNLHSKLILKLFCKNWKTNSPFSPSFRPGWPASAPVAHFLRAGLAPAGRPFPSRSGQSPAPPHFLPRRTAAAQQGARPSQTPAPRVLSLSR